MPAAFEQLRLFDPDYEVYAGLVVTGKQLLEDEVRLDAYILAQQLLSQNFGPPSGEQENGQALVTPFV